MNPLFIHSFTIYIDHLEYIGSISYAGLQILTPFILQYQKITCINIIINLIRKVS